MSARFFLTILLCLLACAYDIPEHDAAIANVENVVKLEGVQPEGLKPQSLMRPLMSSEGGERKRPSLRLRSQRVTLSGGASFDLKLPEGFGISVAAEGLRRARFMAKSPDGRLFVTDMHDRTDNQKGMVYILEEFDRERRAFRKIRPYLTKLRNPNSLAFHTDGNGQTWLYLALTDRLLRYRYRSGDTAPSSSPETLATFPAYGLSYKYGGWHLTRTVVAGGNGKIYVAVGSSCNACEEKEDVRASVIEMEPDGKGQRIYARGLRNAVGLKWVNGTLFATNMGADHLGDARPEDNLYALEPGMNYGWPYCYEYRSKIHVDPKFASSPKRVDPRTVPRAYASFPAHSAPLGLEYFDSLGSGLPLDHFFLVALHGASRISLKHGYSVAYVAQGIPARDFIAGFQQGRKIHGRPCDILRDGSDAFFLTDDHAGVVYYVYRRG